MLAPGTPPSSMYASKVTLLGVVFSFCMQPRCAKEEERKSVRAWRVAARTDHFNNILSWHCKHGLNLPHGQHRCGLHASTHLRQSCAGLDSCVTHEYKFFNYNSFTPPPIKLHLTFVLTQATQLFPGYLCHICAHFSFTH